MEMPATIPLPTTSRAMTIDPLQELVVVTNSFNKQHLDMRTHDIKTLLILLAL